MAYILKQHFSVHFLERKFLYIDANLIDKFIQTFPIDNKSALVLVMTWCLTGDKPLSEAMVTQLSMYIHHQQASKSLLTPFPPGQNGHHFADNIFRCIFLKENAWILIKISLNFVPKGSINNIPALVHIMVWCRIGDTPLSELMLTLFTEAYTRH